MCLKDKYWLTVLPVCLFALAGCPQLRGGPNRYIKRDVKPAELVGTWQVTDNSLERLVKEGYSKYVKKELNQLILLDGGMCNICMYDPWIPTPTPEEDEECYKPLTGATWKITKQIAYVGHRETMVPAVEITIEKVEETPDGSNIFTRIFRLYIVEEKGHIVLWTFINDPDYRKYMDFIRVPEQAVTQGITSPGTVSE
jgi:hypothetical protein